MLLLRLAARRTRNAQVIDSNPIAGSTAAAVSNEMPQLAPLAS